MSVSEEQGSSRPPRLERTTLSELIQLRRDLHRYPELRFTEQRTARTLAGRLTSAGFSVRTGFAGTAVLGTIDSGRPGPHVLLRTDMDALPTADLTAKPYASQHAGVSHACGHDVHCAVAVGAASAVTAGGLARGRLSVLCQPAEEIPFGEASGAQSVLDSGVLQELGDIAAVLGLHSWPQLPAGAIGVDPVTAMAAKLAFRISVTGHGAHAATPHLGRDALLAASQLTLTLHTLIGRRTGSSEQAALNVGTFRAGTSQSIVPRSAEVTGTIRSIDDDVATRLRDAVDKAADGVGMTFGVDAEVEWKNQMPAVRNDCRLVELALRELPSARHVDAVVPLASAPMTTDDFALYAARWPALYLKLGVATPGAPSWPSLHDGRFDVDESCIAAGAGALAGLTTAILDGGLDNAGSGNSRRPARHQ